MEKSDNKNIEQGHEDLETHPNVHNSPLKSKSKWSLFTIF